MYHYVFIAYLFILKPECKHAHVYSPRVKRIRIYISFNSFHSSHDYLRNTRVHTHTRTSIIVVYAHTRQYSDYHMTIIYHSTVVCTRRTPVDRTTAHHSVLKSTVDLYFRIYLYYFYFQYLLF